MWRQLADLLVSKADTAAIDGNMPGNGTQKRRLPATGLPHDHGISGLRKLHIDIDEHAIVAIAFLYGTQRKQSISLPARGESSRCPMLGHAAPARIARVCPSSPTRAHPDARSTNAPGRSR